MKNINLFIKFLGVCSILIANQVFAADLDNISFEASKATRGSTISIPEKVIIDYCGDFDGCTLRLGMHDWDGTRRVASRESLFYYDIVTKNWRASLSDKMGRNNSVSTEHVIHAWACYFTDGAFSAWANQSDYTDDFGLLSWNDSGFNANCRLTIID